jgi:hypothetical protein
MTKSKPKPTWPARIRVSNLRKFRIALSLLIISLIATVIAAKYFKADPEAVRADQAAAQITAVKKTGYSRNRRLVIEGEEKV